jgi:hypothetical protein
VEIVRITGFGQEGRASMRSIVSVYTIREPSPSGDVEAITAEPAPSARLISESTSLGRAKNPQTYSM